MEVQVLYRLEGIFTVVADDSVTVFKTQIRRDLVDPSSVDSTMKVPEH